MVHQLCSSLFLEDESPVVGDLRLLSAHGRLHSFNGAFINIAWLADDLVKTSVNILVLGVDATDLPLDAGFSVFRFVHAG